MKKQIIIYLLSPVLLFISLELIFAYSDYYLLLSVAANLVIILSIFVLAGIKDIRSNARHLILPFIFVNGISILSLIITHAWLIHFLYVLAFVFWFSLLKRLSVIFEGDPSPELILSIDSIKLYASLTSVYFFSASFFGVLFFLNYSVFPLLAALAAALFLASWTSLSVYGIDMSRSMPYAVINTLVLVELAWTLTLLPFTFAVSGLLLSVFYYISSGLTRNSLLDKLTAQSLKIYLGLGAACVLSIVLTARWF